MSRRRRNNGANVSFFAFQDIITAVTGILILIVILMVLMLRTPTAAAPDPIEAETRSLAEIEKLIQEAISKIREFSTVDFNIDGESIEDLEDEIRDLEKQLESEGNSLHLTLIMKVADLESRLKSTLAKITEMDQQRTDLTETLSEFETVLSEKEIIVSEASSTPQLWLKMSVTDKAPIPFEVSSNGIIQRSLEDPGFKLAVRPENISQPLRDTAKDADSSTDYYVFFIRPSGITYVDEIESLVAQEGFDLGLRPLAEELELKIYNEETLDFTP